MNPAPPGQRLRLPLNSDNLNGASSSTPSSSGPIRSVPRSSPRSGPGRPEGVSCKCKCCGQVGFYTKTCGVKHPCLAGKCVSVDVPKNVPSSPPFPVVPFPEQLYEVPCVGCKETLQFAVSRPGGVQLVCGGCSAVMRAEISTPEQSLKPTLARSPPHADRSAHQRTIPRRRSDSAGELHPEGQQIGFPPMPKMTACTRCKSELEFRPTPSPAVIHCYACSNRMLFPGYRVAPPAHQETASSLPAYVGLQMMDDFVTDFAGSCSPDQVSVSA